MANESNRKYEGGQGEITRHAQQQQRLSHHEDDNSGPDTHAGTQNPAGARLDEDRQQHDEAEKNSELRKEKGSQKS
jgi:hypothetical protein